MESMKPPRNITKYIPKLVAIARLIDLAASLLFRDGSLMKWELRTWHWDDEWPKAQSGKRVLATQSKFSSGTVEP